MPISDYTNGYRIYSKSAVDHISKNCGKIGDGFIILSEIFSQNVSDITLAFINIITNKKREMHLEAIAEKHAKQRFEMMCQ